MKDFSSRLEGALRVFLAERRRIYSAPERARRMEQAVRSFVSEAFLLGYDSEEIVEHVTRQTRKRKGGGTR